jgi:1-acyl-sn-glycerol-3-phosphate acyltransferase
MESETKVSPKPRSSELHPELVRLVPMTWWRRFFRRFMRWFSRVLVWIWLEVTIEGLEYIPPNGPGLIVSNHLGDADMIIGFAFSPVTVDPISKIELYRIPILGFILNTYGVIWVHRGQADKKAIKVIMQALSDGRFVGIAPEGRESLTGSLEEGTGGAAYIALKTDVPLIPVTFTGTENSRVFSNMKRMKRTKTTITVGKPFKLQALPDRRESIKTGTDTIMHVLARQLPPQYRGVYQTEEAE